MDPSYKKYFPNMKPSDTLISGSSPNAATAQKIQIQNAKWAGYSGFNKTGKSFYDNKTGMYTNVALFDKTKFNMNLGSKEKDTIGNFSEKDKKTISILIGGFNPDSPLKLNMDKVNLEEGMGNMREILKEEMEKNKGKWGKN